MHGNHSLLNLDLARHWQEEQIAKAARRHAFDLYSKPSSRSRLSTVRQAIGVSLIAIGERLRPDDCGLIGEDISADSICLNLAR